jgi:hypothetical protein
MRLPFVAFVALLALMVHALLSLGNAPVCIAAHRQATVVAQTAPPQPMQANLTSPLTLPQYLEAVLIHDPDIQLAHARVREARARQQDVVKPRFIKLFNFFNAENLQGSAESDLKAAQARADADTSHALFEAGQFAIKLAKAELDAWGQVDAVVLAQKQANLAQLGFNAGKQTRYQLDIAQGQWQQAQQGFRLKSQAVSEQHLKLAATVLTAHQLEQPAQLTLTLPSLYTPVGSLVWAPITTEASSLCGNAMTLAADNRRELAEFDYRVKGLGQLIKASKPNQRPLLLTNQQQLMIKRQMFERELAVAITQTCDAQEVLAHTLPTLFTLSQQAHQSVDRADMGLKAGYISQLEWQQVHHTWVQAHINWKHAELDNALLGWQLRYLTGQLTPALWVSALPSVYSSRLAATP